MRQGRKFSTETDNGNWQGRGHLLHLVSVIGTACKATGTIPNSKGKGGELNSYYQFYIYPSSSSEQPGPAC